MMVPATLFPVSTGFDGQTAEDWRYASVCLGFILLSGGSRFRWTFHHSMGSFIRRGGANDQLVDAPGAKK